MIEPQSSQGWRQTKFSDVDLRMVGDMCSSPLSKAIRRDLLTTQLPVWSDETHRGLARLGEWWLDAVAVAIRRKALPFAGTPDWPSGFLAVKCTFGPFRKLHLFRSEQSIAWATFTEPQFTKGLAYFLKDSDADVKVARVHALLKALGAAELAKGLNEIEVAAEAEIAGGKRIDLLLEWKDSKNNRYAVAIEAKLGHHVTSGQLPAYREHLKKIAGEDRRRLVVVSPRRSGKTEKSLRQNREWFWMAWRDLLVAHERALNDKYDDKEYREFRRTLWDQTG